MRVFALLVLVPIVYGLGAPKLLGGYENSDVNSKQNKEMAEFALQEVNKNEKDTNSLRQLSEIVSVKTQMVAGVNYDIVMNVKKGDTVEECEVVVYDIPWENKRTLTSSTCKPKPSTLGGEKNVDLDKDVLDAAAFATDSYNQEVNSLFRMGAAKIENAKKQTTAGTLYSFDITFVPTNCMNSKENLGKTLKDCPLNDAGTKRKCSYKVSFQAWRDPKYKIESEKCGEETALTSAKSEMASKLKNLLGQHSQPLLGDLLLKGVPMSALEGQLKDKPSLNDLMTPQNMLGGLKAGLGNKVGDLYNHIAPLKKRDITSVKDLHPLLADIGSRVLSAYHQGKKDYLNEDGKVDLDRVLGKDGHDMVNDGLEKLLGADGHDLLQHGLDQLLGGDGHDNQEHGLDKLLGDKIPHGNLIGGGDHDYKPHGNLIGGGDHDYKPHGNIGGDDHDYKKHGNLIGGGDHDYKKHGNLIGGGDHDYKPHGNIGGGDHDYKPHGNIGGDDHDYKKHGNLIGGGDHDYKKHGNLIGGGDHDYKNHGNLIGGGDHDYKNHGGILGGDGHDLCHMGHFKEFMIKHEKSYRSVGEETKRFKVFCDNMALARRLNETEQGTAVYGATKFADLTPDEFRQLYLSKKNWADIPNKGESQMWRAKIPRGEAPKSFDWRDHGAVTPVKNQGQCGSCWAFSTTGNIEGQWKIKRGNLVSLSEQELVDCDKLDEGCNGGLPSNAYMSIMKLGGLETESDYKYEAENEKCLFNKSEVAVKINGAVNISSDEGEMAAWLAQNGPISIGINAMAMQFYFGGISHPWKIFCNPGNLDHGVLIVGYGVEGTEPYWIVKNSWGPDWGEKGYYRVYRGGGVCGLNTMCTSAVVN